MIPLKALYEVKLIVDGRQHFYQIGEEEKWHPGVTSVLSAAIPKPALLPWALNMMSENVRDSLTKWPKGNLMEEEDIEKIVKDGKNIYKKKASEAADIGKEVHLAIDGIIRNKAVVPGEYIKAGVDGFLKWRETNNLEIVLGDTKLGSKLFGYGGSMDFVAFKGPDPIIFDVKTTKRRKDRDHGVYNEYGLQLAAYAQAFHETYGLRPKEA